MHRFRPDMHQLSFYLNPLFISKNEWNWAQEQDLVFKKRVKKRKCYAWELSWKKFRLTCDEKTEGRGAVLQSQDGKEMRRPISFEWRFLTDINPEQEFNQ